MDITSDLKCLLIRGTDILNPLNDPYDPFTRPTLSKANLKLSDLESQFFSDLASHFWGCDGTVLLHRLPQPTGSPLDLGDQAIWHGIYTAMLAIRSSVEPDRAGNGLLIHAVRGLQMHQTIHGEHRPRLIRGISDDQKTWQDDASNDTATGHLAGIYFGWKYGPPTLQPVFQHLAAGLGSELLNNHHALIRADGTPTTYGALEQGWKTDPLRITLALAVYAVASTLTKEPAFMQAYSDLFKKYQDLIPYPKVQLWWMDNHGDSHRAAIHLAICADLTSGDARQLYIQGLSRLRRLVRKQGNIWVNALCKWGGWGESPDDRIEALKVLSEFTLADKSWNVERINSSHPTINDFTFKIIQWGGQLVSTQPMPVWAKGSQDFIWQRHPYSVDDWKGRSQPDSRYNGGDFLAAYWLSRLTGILNAND